MNAPFQRPNALPLLPPDGATENEPAAEGDTTWTAPKFVRSFACLAGECPDTCCNGLTVGMNGSELVALERAAADHPQLRAAFLEEVRDTPDGGPAGAAAVLHHPERDCAFLDADRLCSVQATAGTSAMNHTCQTFPKLARPAGEGQVEVLASLGCPEVARLALTEPDALQSEAIEPPELRPSQRAISEDPFRGLIVGLLTAPNASIGTRFLAAALALDAIEEGAAPDDVLLALNTDASWIDLEEQSSDHAPDPILRATVAQDALIARAGRAPQGRFRNLVEQACFATPPDPIDVEAFFQTRPESAADARALADKMQALARDEPWTLACANYGAVRWMLNAPATLQQARVTLGRLGMEIAAAELLCAAGAEPVEAFSRVARELSHVKELSTLLDEYVCERGLDQLHGQVAVRPS